jgi:hypothetical protein
MHWGSQVAVQKLFARVIACDAGDPGSIPAAEACLSRGALQEDGWSSDNSLRSINYIVHKQRLLFVGRPTYS